MRALLAAVAARIVLSEETFFHDPRRYLLSSLALPTAATILDASPTRPYLALAFRLDLREIASLVLDGSLPRPKLLSDGRAMATGLVTLPLLDAFRRLLDLIEQPEDAHLRQAIRAILSGSDLSYAIDESRLLVGPH